MTDRHPFDETVFNYCALAGVDCLCVDVGEAERLGEAACELEKPMKRARRTIRARAGGASAAVRETEWNCSPKDVPPPSRCILKLPVRGLACNGNHRRCVLIEPSDLVFLLCDCDEVKTHVRAQSHYGQARPHQHQGIAAMTRLCLH